MVCGINESDTHLADFALGPANRRNNRKVAHAYIFHCVGDFDIDCAVQAAVGNECDSVFLQ